MLNLGHSKNNTWWQSKAYFRDAGELSQQETYELTQLYLWGKHEYDISIDAKKKYLADSMFLNKNPK